MQQRALKAAAAICAAVVLLSTSPSALHGRPAAAITEPSLADPSLAIPSLADPSLLPAEASPSPDPAPTASPEPSASPDPNANGDDHRAWPHGSPEPSAIASLDPSVVATPAGSASPAASDSSGPYTFDDEFDGTSLGSNWLRHFHCCGTLAGFDPSLTTVSGGYLQMRVDDRSTGWFGDLIDTKTTFTQKYGSFEARIKIPKGAGLWPAWWLYYAGNGTEAEIDQMEVCANDLGDNGGNDASLLHTTVHWTGGGSLGSRYRTVDLSSGFHVYGVDWRPDAIRFYLDGTLVWTFTDTAHIPDVALPLILNLGVGGSWCGAPDGTTPDGATMLVDWVHVRP